MMRTLILCYLVWQATAALASDYCSASDNNDGDYCSASGNNNDDEPLPNMGLYADAQGYIESRDKELNHKYFEEEGQHKLVKHLIVGRGIASTNLFSARYCNVKKNKSQCTNFIAGDDVLVVGDEVTGQWDTSTYTFAQPFSAMAFPFLPYNPKDFVPQRRIKQNDFVSCIDLHKAILVSQTVFTMPVLSAVVVDIKHHLPPYPKTGCVGSSFTVTLKQAASNKTTTICVNEIDIATGNGLPRDIFKNTTQCDSTSYNYGLDKVSYNNLTSRPDNPDVFGGAPAVITYKDFVIAPNETTAGVVAMRHKNTIPTIIVYGGGGTSVAAIRRAMLGKDDISTNPIYVNSNGKYNGKNPQMLREVLHKPLSQNAKVFWFSRDPLDSPYLAGFNAVRIGSSYDILSVFSEANNNAENKYKYGEVHLGYDLANIDATSKIATFCPKIANQSTLDTQPCNITWDGTRHGCCRVKFDQFVESAGEDQTVDREELWEVGCDDPKNRKEDRFGNMTVLCASGFPSVDDGIQSSDTLTQMKACIPYALGFELTKDTLRGGEDTLRLHGASAAKEASKQKFQKISQHFLDNGRVSALNFYGNMFFMGAQLQVYASGVLKKRLTKINVAMDLQEVMLQFMTQCGVPSQASLDFLSHLRLVHSGVYRESFLEDPIRWPLHPAGMLPDSPDKDISLKEYIQSRKELSKYLAIQDGVTLVCRQSGVRSFLARVRDLKRKLRPPQARRGKLPRYVDAHQQDGSSVTIF
eukprot:scaffold61790_cov49-Attheya_sp.AAC.1